MATGLGCGACLAYLVTFRSLTPVSSKQMESSYHPVNLLFVVIGFAVEYHL
jgi:hypothetical protein